MSVSVAAPVEDALRSHVRRVNTYINSIVDYDSFDEFLEAHMSHGPMTLDAFRSCRWMLQSDFPGPVKEQLFQGPCEFINEYPWIGDGLAWARRELKSE